MKHKKIKPNNIDYTTPYVMPILLFIMDYLAILAAQAAAICLRQNLTILSYYNHMNDIPAMYFYFLVPCVFVAFLYNSQAYVNRIPFWDVIQKVFYAVLYSIMVCIVMMYFGHIAGGVSRIYVILLGLLAFCFLCTFRYFLKKILCTFNLLLEPIIVIGAGKTAELIDREIGNDTGFGFKIIGFIDDNPVSEKLPLKYPILGKFNNIERVIKAAKVSTVIIAVPGLDKEKQLQLINRIQPLVKNISFVPDLIGAPISNMELQKLYNARIMMLKVKNNMSSWYNRLLKNISDKIGGYIIFILCIPILAVIAVCIKKDSKGTVFFNAKRIGKNNREFTCYKFRTMYANADEILEQYLKDNPQARDEWSTFRKIRGCDPRVTKVGKWLRKYSLDELPQVINVIKGDMGLVGPRPYLPEERGQMGDFIKIITQTLPGITGLWQVSGRNEITFEDRLKMDAWYIQNWSIWMDIVLLYKTIYVVLFSKGAY